MKRENLLTLIIFLLNFKEILGFYIKLELPSHVVSGKSALLNCMYKLPDGDELYAIKFYKNGREFYRYLPHEKPEVKVFPLPGININFLLRKNPKFRARKLKRNNSFLHYVQLVNVNIQSSGTYQCEVSAESPSFSIAMDRKEMTVVVLPESIPEIKGDQNEYNVGDKLKLNCTSFRSKPAANLEWHINGNKVLSSMLHKYRTYIDKDGLETSILGLQLEVEEQHFQNGVLTVRCNAAIGDVYAGSKELRISRQQTKFITSSVLPESIPEITGYQNEYNVGDKLELNCTSFRSKPAAHLEWHINGNKVLQSMLRKYRTHIDKHGLETSILGLHLEVEEQHFQNGVLTVRCNAAIGDVYEGSKELRISRQQTKFITSSEIGQIPTPTASHNQYQWVNFKKEKQFQIIRSTALETWQGADSICKSSPSESESNPRLMSIKSQEQQDYLVQYLFMENHILDSVWLNCKLNEITGEFEWNDGTKLLYSNWAKENVFNDQYKCAKIVSGDRTGEWVKSKCSERNAVVCEVDQVWTLRTLQNALLSLKYEREQDQREINNLKSNPVPMGFIYVQLPGQLPPPTLWPQTTWKDVSSDYAGLFFRVVGGGAAEFGELQKDNTRRIAQVKMEHTKEDTHPLIPSNGTWSTFARTGDHCESNNHRAHSYRLTKGEVRPRNKAMKIWKRIN